MKSDLFINPLILMTAMKHFLYAFLFTCLGSLAACSSGSVTQWTNTDSLKPDDPLTDQELSSIEFGIEFHELGDFERAREVYFEILEDNPNSSLTLYQIAFAYNVEGDVDSCIRYAGEAAQIRSEGRGEALHMLGVCLDMAGRPEDAISVFNEGIRENPDNYLSYYSLAVTSIHIGEVGEAIQYLQQSLKQNPEHASSHYLLASIYNDLNHPFAAWLGYNYFLLYESHTPRAVEAKRQLLDILTPDSSVDEEGKTNINLNIGSLLGGDGVMNRADLTFGISMVQRNISEEDKSETEIINELYNSGFKLGEELHAEEDASGAVWEIYAPFFSQLNNEGHTKALIGVIFEHSGLEGIDEWIKMNEKSIEKFKGWLYSY